MITEYLIEKMEGRGLLGGKTRYKFTGSISLDATESAIVNSFSPRASNVLDYFEATEEMRNKLIAFGPIRSYIGGHSFEFETIQLASKFQAVFISACHGYKDQIAGTAAVAETLGQKIREEI